MKYKYTELKDAKSMAEYLNMGNDSYTATITQEGNFWVVRG